MGIVKLKNLRKKANYSQEYIGDKLSISQSTYNKKENGINPFTLEEIKLLRIILNIKDSDIIDIFLK